MIATDVGGERYRLVFEHFGDAGWRDGMLINRGTVATLERRNGEGWVTVQGGRADCSDDDHYVRETGRRIALKRLYRKACPPGQQSGTSHESTNAKAMRRLMRAYFDRPRGRR